MLRMIVKAYNTSNLDGLFHLCFKIGRCLILPFLRQCILAGPRHIINCW